MEKWWVNFPWRVVQANFSEIDTLNFDADVYIEELKSFHCNAVLINAGGMLASYPTKLADHPQSDYIDHFDLKALVEKCHENGIKAIARTDFSKMRRDVYERHPDWAFRTKDGDIIDYNGYVHTCLCGGFQGGYMDEIIREMLEEIPFDGIYCNMGTFNSYTVDYSYNMYGACHCENCQRRFREKYGFEIPQKMQPGDPAAVAFARFQMEVSAEQKARLKAGIRDLEKASDPVHEARSNEEYVLPRPLKVGDNVLIYDIDKTATVLELPKSGDMVLVQAGIIKTRVPLKNLRLTDRREKEKKKLGGHRNVTKAPGSDTTVRNEIDLRGMNVEEAIMEVDAFIDHALLRNLNQLTIIHGKGTGVLRSGIHQHLKRHKAVKTFRLGVYGEGESGVTVVELK